MSLARWRGQLTKGQLVCVCIDQPRDHLVTPLKKYFPFHIYGSTQTHIQSTRLVSGMNYGLNMRSKRVSMDEILCARSNQVEINQSLRTPRRKWVRESEMNLEGVMHVGCSTPKLVFQFGRVLSTDKPHFGYKYRINQIFTALGHFEWSAKLGIWFVGCWTRVFGVVTLKHKWKVIYSTRSMHFINFNDFK